MPKQLSNVLLFGAMMAMATVAAPLLAQDVVTQQKYPFDVAIGYSATLSNPVNGSRFWMQGGSAQLTGELYRGLAVTADVTGMHGNHINASGTGLDLVTAVFGPRYTWSPAHHKYALFGQTLVGSAFGFKSVFPNPAGALSSANSLALVLGGGMNVNLSPHFALRAFEADWMRTQLPNATSNVQNNLQLAAGAVLRFR
jgi:hypothetical protein